MLGLLALGLKVGHVHFIFFVSISFALGSQFPVEYGLKTWWYLQKVCTTSTERHMTVGSHQDQAGKSKGLGCN